MFFSTVSENELQTHYKSNGYFVPGSRKLLKRCKNNGHFVPGSETTIKVMVILSPALVRSSIVRDILAFTLRRLDVSQFKHWICIDSVKTGTRICDWLTCCTRSGGHDATARSMVAQLTGGLRYHSAAVSIAERGFGSDRWAALPWLQAMANCFTIWGFQASLKKIKSFTK